MPNPTLLSIDSDDMLWTLGLTNFEDEKFRALDDFLRKVKFAESNVPFNDERLEDLELSFLEYCDKVLLKVAKDILNEEIVEDMHHEAYRTNLTHHLEEVAELKEEENLAPPFLIIEETQLLIEQLEDVGESWLALSFLGMDKVNALYDLVSLLESGKGKQDIYDTLRELMLDLLQLTPLLRGVERDYFGAFVRELKGEMLLFFVQRFLQANLEYGIYLQDQYLRKNPELMKRIATRLKKEATKKAKAWVA
jgi:hypothetical protein